MDESLVIPFLLTIAGAVVALVVAAVVIRRRAVEAKAMAARGSALEFWTCAGCGMGNAGDRTACFACHVERPKDGSAA